MLTVSYHEGHNNDDDEDNISEILEDNQNIENKRTNGKTHCIAIFKKSCSKLLDCFVLLHYIHWLICLSFIGWLARIPALWLLMSECVLYNWYLLMCSQCHFIRVNRANHPDTVIVSLLFYVCYKSWYQQCWLYGWCVLTKTPMIWSIIHKKMTPTPTKRSTRSSRKKATRSVIGMFISCTYD